MWQIWQVLVNAHVCTAASACVWMIRNNATFILDQLICTGTLS